MENKIDLREVLPFIPPQEVDYATWVSVGMALHEGGYGCSVWEDWSRIDGGRYHPGECQRKWATFRGVSAPVTGGTIVQLAKAYGWRPAGSDPGHELDWDSTIGSGRIIDSSWLEGQEVLEPLDWDPARELTTYLETLFEPSENVGYVTESWEKDGRYLPSKGSFDRTAGELIQAINTYSGDLGAALGDYDPRVGAWIRFNPLDGKGVKNDNVTEYRYALVESDTMDLERQHAMIKELELPVACLVYSGGRSLHAIVRIEAADYTEYRSRVDYLYGVLRKNGMTVDTQNKNPSRLSRMPGVTRNGKKQFLVSTNIGKSSFQEWKEWIESVSDDLPDIQNISAVKNHRPALAPSLIEGVLRKGHKLLLTGPSKAGKSFALIELAIAIAEGRSWLGFSCAQGNVLYVNLELDANSCWNRILDVYDILGISPSDNIDVWNLRGHSSPMDKLTPKLIRRCLKKRYTAIIIDPIYKVITGDENSADQMSNFCNQFDRVATELGCAVINCHHHSKGSQGQKRSMDRASGSGVFARDPDALLDLIELEVPDSVWQVETDREILRVCRQYLDDNVLHWQDSISQDDQCIAAKVRELAKNRLCTEVYERLTADISAAERAVKARTAWRVEGTLREFPRFDPINLWFDYPRHRVDDTGILGDLEAEGEAPPWQKGGKKTKANAEKRAKSEAQKFEEAVNNCRAGEPPTTKDLQEWYSNAGEEVTIRTIQKWVKKFGFYVDRNKGRVYKRQDEGSEES